jgi:hypothetical protein
LSNHLFFEVNCLKDKLGSLGNNQNAHKLDARCRLKIKICGKGPENDEKCVYQTLIAVSGLYFAMSQQIKYFK